MADTLLAVCLTVLAVRGVPSRTKIEGPKIGVALNSSQPKLVEITGITPDSPAEHAGLRAGDRVVTVDGAPVADNDDLRRTLGATLAGGARHLVVARGGENIEVDVVPVTGLAARAAPPRPLFEPVGGPEDSEPGRQLVLYGVVHTSILALMLFFARRRENRETAAPFGIAAAFVLAMVASLLTYRGLERLLGPSLGVAILGILGTGMTILVAGVILARREPPSLGPATDTLRTVGLGILYYFVGVIRVGFIVAVFIPSVFTADRNVLGLSAAWPLSGIVLVVFATVIVAPIGEELLYRGALLPWAARWSSPTAAVLWTATAFAAGHLYYGAGAVLIFVVGVVLGWARMRTGRLRASIALHMLLNAVVCVQFLKSG